MCMSSAEEIVLIKTVSSSVKFRQCCIENTYNSGVFTYFESENYYFNILFNIAIFFNSPLPWNRKKETFELSWSEDYSAKYHCDYFIRFEGYMIELYVYHSFGISFVSSEEFLALQYPYNRYSYFLQSNLLLLCFQVNLHLVSTYYKFFTAEAVVN